MRVADGQPQALLPRRRADHRARIREARPAAEPRLVVGALAERKQRPRLRHQPVELHRRRRRIARGKLGAGGETNALRHRRDQIARLGVDHRPRQRRVALAAKMPVIAALERHRQPDAHRLQQIRRPRPQRHHDVRRIQPAFLGLDPPAAAGAVQRARIAGQRDAAELGEARRIGPRHRQRIADAGGLRPEHAVAEHRPQRRLQRLHASGIERLERQVEFPRQIEFALQRGEDAGRCGTA